ncbi:MAG: hypothetical protein VX205_00150 [Pseudomonadota bacterium]|nr:hypothetical protein [Pseudomonadota bacterium]
MEPTTNICARFKPLLSEAEAALDRRQQQYPALVASGRLDETAAASEIRTWQAIVADWRVAILGQGRKDDAASIDDKIAALTQAIQRHNAALAKEIRGSAEAVRRDCVEGADLARLRDRHGDAVDTILDLHHRRGRIEELRDWYRSEQAGWLGLFHGIEDYLAFHRQVRATRQQKRAA